MPVETDYQAALAAASRLLHQLDARPHLRRHERLATVTYLILEAIQAGRSDAAVFAGSSAWAEKEDLS